MRGLLARRWHGAKPQRYGLVDLDLETAILELELEVDVGSVRRGPTSSVTSCRTRRAPAGATSPRTPAATPPMTPRPRSRSATTGRWPAGSGRSVTATAYAQPRSAICSAPARVSAPLVVASRGQAFLNDLRRPRSTAADGRLQHVGQIGGQLCGDIHRRSLGVGKNPNDARGVARRRATSTGHGQPSPHRRCSSDLPAGWPSSTSRTRRDGRDSPTPVRPRRLRLVTLASGSADFFPLSGASSSRRTRKGTFRNQRVRPRRTRR